MTRQFVLPFVLVTSLFFAWGFAYGLLDVLNKHFQTVLGVTKLQSTGLQVAYFVSPTLTATASTLEPHESRV